MKSPRFGSKFSLVLVAAASLGAFACGSSEDDTGLTQAIGGSAGSTAPAKGGSPSKGGGAGSSQGKGGGSTTGCGDLLACCISLADPDDKSSCQSTAAALADSENGAVQCQKALAAYQAQGLCEGSGGSAGKGGNAGKGGSAGKGGNAGKGGSAGKGGGAGKGGSAGSAGVGGSEAAGSGGSEAAGSGGNEAAGSGGNEAAGSGGNEAAGSGGSAVGGAAGEAQGGAGQGGSTAGQGGTTAGAGGTIAGAGGSAGQAGAGGAPIELTREAACASWAQALCTKADSCGGIVRAYYEDVADCVERSAMLDCKLRFGTGTLVVPWTPAEIAACGDGWNLASCNDLLLSDPAACAGHKGTRNNGDGCTNGSECKSGLCSTGGTRVFSDNEASCGSCLNPLPIEQPAANCFSDNDCSDPALYCDETTGACVRPRLEQQSCANVPCASGRYCDSNAKCQLRQPKGSSCTGDSQCSGRFGLLCVAGSCEVQVKSIGTLCPNSGALYCAADGECSGVSGNDRCVLPLDDDAACSEGFPPFVPADNCRHPAICVKQKCVTDYFCNP